MQKKVRIDEETCLKTAGLIRNIHPRKEFYERPFLRIVAPDETRMRGIFYAVAICHQTYQLQDKGLNLYGWDYLEHVFSRLMTDQDALLQPGALLNISFNELSNALASMFSADGNPSNSSLDRLAERTGMLIELDTFIANFYHSSLMSLVAETGRKLLNSGNGFYELLPSVLAFADPLKKKITFLLKLLEEAGLVEIIDTENYIPIMDYHMQRVLLRMGCVEVNDEDLYKILVNRSLLDNDEDVRIACIEAFKVISIASGHAVTKMNDFFWSLGRSCCNENPLCQVGTCEKSPCTFAQIVELEEHTTCHFKSACKGFNDAKYRKLWQPIVDTHYY
jgi:hypothetical protein